MAKAVINLQKESGGIVKISPVDGIGITEVTVPESGELVTKEYADLKVALASFIGANQSLAFNGYQKLPGGLIIQWGYTDNISSGSIVNLPISFPTNALVVVINHVGSALFLKNCIPYSKSQLQIYHNYGSPVYVNYIVIGH